MCFTSYASQTPNLILKQLLISKLLISYQLYDTSQDKERAMNTNHKTLGSLIETEQINKPSKQRNQGESYMKEKNVFDDKCNFLFERNKL